jgi:hypothetical protein
MSAIQSLLCNCRDQYGFRTSVDYCCCQLVIEVVCECLCSLALQSCMEDHRRLFYAGVAAEFMHPWLSVTQTYAASLKVPLILEYALCVSASVSVSRRHWHDNSVPVLHTSG